MKDSRLTYEQFATIVGTRPGLSSKDCGNDHWQITGGEFLVNVWPRTKRGFRFHVAGMVGAKTGNLGQAINAARQAVILPQGALRNHRTAYYKAVRRELLSTDPHCFYCRRKLFESTATLDHYIPLSKGGSNSHDNLRLACGECNREKACKMPTAHRKTVRVWLFPVDRFVEYQPRDEAWARPLGFGREDVRSVTFAGASRSGVVIAKAEATP